MEAKLRWIDHLLFEGVPESGHKVLFDTASSVGGTEQAPTPMEYMLLAIGACTAMDVISILKKMRQEVTEYRVRLVADRNPEHPRYFTRVVIEHILRGNALDPTLVEKAVNLSDTKYCSAAATLRHQVEVTSRFFIEQVEPNSNISP